MTEPLGSPLSPLSSPPLTDEHGAADWMSSPDPDFSGSAEPRFLVATANGTASDNIDGPESGRQQHARRRPSAASLVPEPSDEHEQQLRSGKRPRRATRDDAPATSAPVNAVPARGGQSAVTPPAAPSTIPPGGLAAVAAPAASTSGSGGRSRGAGSGGGSSSGVDALQNEAKKLKHHADRMDREGNTQEAMQCYFHAGLKFIECAQRLDDKAGGSGGTMFRDTARLFDFTARKAASAGDQPTAALAYRCVALCYQRACPPSRLGPILDELRHQQAQLLPSPGSTPPLPGAAAATNGAATAAGGASSAGGSGGNPSPGSLHPSPSPSPPIISPGSAAPTAPPAAGLSAASPLRSHSAAASARTGSTNSRQQVSLLQDLEMLVRAADARHKSMVASGMSKREVYDFCEAIRTEFGEKHG